MTKILVEISCPSTARSYEFWISKQMLIRDIIAICMKEICMTEGSKSIFSDSKNISLFSQRLCMPLNENYTATEAGIIGGDKLMIV
ncbi:MAG: hypothetical protein E7507_05530 [Ruminococcus sp.]|nr:hypothetical protein [Ruminococcus sp.]